MLSASLVNKEDIKSQKGRGIIALADESNYVRTLPTGVVPLATPIEQISAAAVDWGGYTAQSKGKFFVRSCPLTPRPGVLENRIAQNASDLPIQVNELRNQMLELDPEGIIIVQPFINAECSAVASKEAIAVGHGHDGVTVGGKGNVILFPRNPNDGFNHVLRRQGYKANEVEIESIYWNHRHAVVQIRAAASHATIAPPPDGAVAGFVPQGKIDTAGKTMILVTSLDDLPKLESALKTYKSDECVVSHPNGSMMSHCAAQCRGAGVPYVIAELKPGDVIAEAASGWVIINPPEGFTAAPTYSPSQYENEFFEGVELASGQWDNTWGQLGTFFHQYCTTPLNDPKMTARLGGAFVGWLIQGGTAACVGEARHASCHSMNTPHRMVACIYEDMKVKYAREKVYDVFRHVNLSLPTAVKVQKIVEFIFTHGQWSSGFGGKRWAKCSRQLAALTRAIIKRNLLSTIKAANVLENAVHNCGWLFNKFISKHYLDTATSGFDIGSVTHFEVFESAEKVTRLKLPHEPKDLSLNLARLSKAIKLSKEGKDDEAIKAVETTNHTMVSEEIESQSQAVFAVKSPQR